MIWIDLEHRLPTDLDIPGWTAWTDAKWSAWLVESQQLADRLADLTNSGKIKERNQLIDDHSSHWGLLKDWLLALSVGKCWFCEVRESYSHYDVEHFRPKKIAKGIDSSERDGYWWLAFDYTNFRACGNVGNRMKGGWFPLQTGSVCSTHENRCEESEVAYLLDPIDPADVSLLAFDDEGKAIAIPGASAWERDRVEVSVKRLKLNEHAALSEARRRTWAAVNVLINQYLTAKSRCTNGGNPAARQKLRDIARQLRDLTLASAELSATARWCVNFRNDPRLMKLLG